MDDSRLVGFTCRTRLAFRFNKVKDLSHRHTIARGSKIKQNPHTEYNTPQNTGFVVKVVAGDVLVYVCISERVAVYKHYALTHTHSSRLH